MFKSLCSITRSIFITNQTNVLSLIVPPAAPKSPQERNGNFSACPGDAFSIPQRGERILSIHAQESGGASRRRRRRTAGMAAEKISACASARKAGRMFGSCRKRSDVDRSSSACSGAAATQPAPLPREFRSANRRSDGRGFAASGFTSAPFTAGKSVFWPENMEIAVKNI